ncbi:MAG TPA: ATP-binding protein [Acidobacteriota bacterium]|nr:ATP-binding protein [Acidobacteriota bacterium]
MSFRWKLLFSYLLTLLVILVLSYIWTQDWLQNFYRDTIRSDLESQVQMMARLIDPERRDIDQVIDSLGEDNSYRISIIDRQGYVIADTEFSGAALEEMGRHHERPEIRQAYRTPVASIARYSISSEEYRLYVAALFQDGQHVLRISVPLDNMGAITWYLRQGLLWRLLVLLLIGAATTWLVVQGISGSVGSLIAAAQKISRGEQVSFIPVTSRDELGDLARHMEEMSKQLRQQMAAVASERDHLTTILNSMREGVLVVDEDGRITITNPAFRETFDLVSDPIGKAPLEAVRSHQMGEAIERVLEGRQEINLEMQKGGKTLLARFTPLGAHSRSGGAVVVLHDISELRRLEKIRKDFVSNVSHELKTPLTSIRGYAETLLAEDSLQPTHRQFAEKIYRNADQLALIIEQLFALARLESGKEALPREPVDFVTLMTEMEQEFGGPLAAKGLDFYYLNLSDRAYFMASHTYIRHVFHNLLENAIKYTDKGGIQIKLERIEDDFLFSVRDTGVGIPAPDLARVFERFYRVNKDRSRLTGGSGVGLAIVKHIVQLHGGRVWAESESGKGTTIFFTLPDLEAISQAAGG